MTRPEIIRADSIDLQDRAAPSAKDHSHQPTAQGKQLASSPLAPHQAETLREVAAETAEEHARSPRVSWNSAGEDLYPEPLAVHDSVSIEGPTAATSKMQRQDALAIAQNGGNDILEEDLDSDGVDDDGLDDDDMDKISSSPSIEDGGYLLAPPSSHLLQPLAPGSLPGSAAPPPKDDDARPSSPCLESVESICTEHIMSQGSHDYHHYQHHRLRRIPGEYRASQNCDLAPASIGRLHGQQAMSSERKWRLGECSQESITSDQSLVDEWPLHGRSATGVPV